jgi:hypothetical protein
MSRLVAQLIDLIIIHAEVMRDFVQHSGPDLLAQPLGVGKIPQQRRRENGNLVRENRRIKGGAIREWNALVESVQRVAARIQPYGQKHFRIRVFFDNDFQIAQLPAKAPGEFIKDARDFFSELTVIQRQ